LGHTRLGYIPKSKKFKALLENYFSNGAFDNSEIEKAIITIAGATLEAAKEGMRIAKSDKGVQFIFSLLTQIVSSSSNDNWYDEMKNLGININNKSQYFDLSCESQKLVDQYLFHNNLGSDLSEMAQSAMGDALSSVVKSETVNLFKSDNDLQSRFNKNTEQENFVCISKSFFSGFLNRYLNFFLSRISVDTNRGKMIRNLQDNRDFNKSLKIHCDQTSYIVEDFSRGWYGKTRYKNKIDKPDTTGFVATALDKLKNEMIMQGKGK